MSVTEIISASGGGLFILLTLIEIVPIKINPWSWLAKHFGKAINAEVMAELTTVKKELDTVKKEQTKIQKQLEQRIQVEDDRNADRQREKILDFNLELVRKLDHTKEDFNEIMIVMDEYETYCMNHPKYKNNRATLAIENIKRVYREREVKNDFL